MIDEPFSYADSRAPLARRKLIGLVEAATGQRRLKAIYLDGRRTRGADESFFAAAVRGLDLQVRCNEEALDAAPRSGPLVVVANHPYGVLDGIVIAWLVEKLRRDYLILTHAALLRAPELRGCLLPVDFAGTAEAMRTNLASREAARAHLEAGGCVVVFPAGGISTAPDRLGRRPAVDAPWQSFVAQLVQRSGAAVLPMYFTGQNSRVFQIVSHLSTTLRLALILHEVRARIGTGIDVVIGRPIPFADLCGIGSRQELVTHLRARTYALMPPAGSDRAPSRLAARFQRIAASGKQLAAGGKRLASRGRAAPGERPAASSGYGQRPR